MFGNQGWSNSRLGINTHTPKVSHRREFREESEEEAKLKSIPAGLRLTDSGYLTNEPVLERSQDKDYWVFKIQKDGDTYYKAIMDSDFEDEHGRTGCAGNRYKRDANGYRATSVQGIIEGLETRYWNQYCTTTKSHYWVDETERYSSGCGDVEADNYDADADYRDDSLCTYSCGDENRVKTAKGNCGVGCLEGYTYDSDKDECVEAQVVSSTASSLDLSKVHPGVLVGGMFLLALITLK